MAVRVNGLIQWNPYAAGPKLYGNGTHAPTYGPVDKSGYAEREQRNRVKRNAMLDYVQAKVTGDFMDPGFLRRG